MVVKRKQDIRANHAKKNSQFNVYNNIDENSQDNVHKNTVNDMHLQDFCQSKNFNKNSSQDINRRQLNDTDYYQNNGEYSFARNGALRGKALRSSDRNKFPLVKDYEQNGEYKIDKKSIREKFRNIEKSYQMLDTDLELEKGHIVVGKNVTEKLKSKNYENSMQNYYNTSFDMTQANLEASFENLARNQKNLLINNFNDSSIRQISPEHAKIVGLNNNINIDMGSINFPPIGAITDFEKVNLAPIDIKKSLVIHASNSHQSPKKKGKKRNKSFVYDNEPWKVEEHESDFMLSTSIVKNK